MSDAPATSAKRIVRHRNWLWLALLPIVAGSLWLASRPPWVNHAAITEDGRYVVTAAMISWNPMQFEVRRIDLRTGQTRRMPRMVQWVPNEFSSDNRWLDFTIENGRFTSISVVRVDDLSSKAVSDPRHWTSAPKFMNGERLIAIDAVGALRIHDLRTSRDQAHSLLPLNTDRIAIPLKTPDRILVIETPMPLGTGGTYKLRLLSVGGTITQLTEWNTQNTFFAEHGNHIYTVNADMDGLECSSLEDGSKLAEYSLTHLFEQVPSPICERLLRESPTLAVMDQMQNRRSFYELNTQKIVGALPPGFEIVDVASDESFAVVGQDSMIRIGTAIDQGVSSLGVVDLESFATRWMHDYGDGIVTAKLTPDQRQLIAAYSDGSVRVFDVNTGEVVRTYRSRAAVLPVFGCVLVGFIVWCVLWVRAGTQLKASPLLDAMFLNGLVAAVFIARVNLSGSMQDASRFAYQTAQSLFASWLVLLTCWVVFGKARWSLRILAPLVGIAGTFVFVLVNFRGEQSGVWQLVIGAFVVAFLCALWFGLLRRWGCCVSNGDCAPLVIRQDRRRIPLRDLFFITAAVAALLAVVRFVSPHRFAAREAAELALIAITVSLTGVAATWAGLGRWPWAVRFVLLALIVLAAGSVLPGVFPNFRHWHSWLFITKYQAFIALFTLGTALLFRSHGWRLGRASCGLMQER